MFRKVLTAAAVAFVVCFFAGCGGGDESKAPEPVAPARIHALLCVADSDVDIGAENTIDMNSINTWLDRISLKTGMPLDRVLLTGSGGTLTRSCLSVAMTNMNIGPDDVIVFYFGGHGAANEGRSTPRWPLMVFLNDEMVDYDEAIAGLNSRGARLVLMLADCCNNFEWQAKVRAEPPDAPPENYRNLFLNTRGYLITAAAAPGEFSLAGEDGGMFTRQFLDSFYNGVVAGHNWRAIMQNAAQEVVGWDEDGRRTVFHPMYDTSL